MAVIVTFVALGQEELVVWVSYLPLPPLALLLFSGLYQFVQLAIMNEQLGVGFRLFLGVAEILGAIGLIAPAITRMLPWVTPLSAACLAGVVASSTVLHLSRGEISSAGITAILFLMATFLAYGRWRVRPIPARGRAEARANAVISRAE